MMQLNIIHVKRQEVIARFLVLVVFVCLWRSSESASAYATNPVAFATNSCHDRSSRPCVHWSRFAYDCNSVTASRATPLTTFGSPIVGTIRDTVLYSSYKDNNCDNTQSSPIRDQVQTIVWHMTQFWKDMVDPVSKRFYYMSYPTTKERVHHHMPVRDLAAIWDTTKLLHFWKYVQNTAVEQPQQQYDDELVLTQSILTSLDVYTASFTTILLDEHDATSTTATTRNVLHLNSQILGESPNIAHSALLLLGSIGAIQLSLIPLTSKMPLKELTVGILSMQRKDGAFYINFDEERQRQQQKELQQGQISAATSNDNRANDNVYRGIDFFPGEAMVSLMEMYQYLQDAPTFGLSADAVDTPYTGTTNNNVENQQLELDELILSSMKDAFDFYSKYYYQGDVDVNYNIWQIQAFCKYYKALVATTASLSSHHLRQNVKQYCIDLCYGIITSKSWKYELSRGRMFYPNLDTVEIACGLDALADVIQLVVNDHGDDDKDDDYAVFLRHAQNAIDFLEWSQHQVPQHPPPSSSTCTSDSPPRGFGYGGLGFGGTYVREQRLDVTGHAMSALTKLYPLL